ncbi:ROK family protein [Arthrobacter sp. 754]|uniref:ROK family protein n=1 Tax=Arthrobacter sp. 754 TaxID=3156315 RepID=UPI003390A77F
MSLTDASPRQGLLASITENRFLALLSDSAAPLSRSDISLLSGISKPAISDAARRLEESGVIVSTGVREGKRGGVAALYEINPARGHSVALALDSAFVAARSVRLDGTVAFDKAERLPHGASSDFVIEIASGLLKSIEKESDSVLLAAAVSVADPVNRKTGDIIPMADSVFPAGHINPVQDLKIQAPEIKVDNDVNWATLAERSVGAMTEVEDFLYIHLGAGLGAGLFLGGALQRGARGLAGEIGRLRAPDGEDLTRTLSRLGFGNSSGSYGLDVQGARQLFERPELAPTTREALGYLTVAIANMVTLLNSSAVVLGGPLAALGPLREHLSTTVPELSLDSVDVIVGTRSPLDGASHEAHRLARASLGF